MKRITYFLFVATFCLGGCVGAADGPNTNLLKNGSFEENVTGWRINWIKGTGQSRIRLDGASDGQKYFYASVGAQSGRLMLRSPSIPVKPGKTYSFSFQYYTGDTRASGGALRLIAYDKQNAFNGYFSTMSMSPTANVWVTESNEFTAPENCTSVIMEFNFRNSVQCRLDNVIFTEKANGNDSLAQRPPLYEELLIPGTAPAKPRAMPYWGYDVSDVSNYRNAALRYGHEYILADRFKVLGERNWAPFDSNGTFSHLRQKFNVPANYYIYAPGHFMDNALKLALARGADPVLAKNASPVDPTYVDAVVELLEKKQSLLHQKNRPQPGFLMFIDELFHRTVSTIPVKEPASTFWKSADGIIREKYGFGKYGLPDSRDEKNTFQWIAYLRWQSDLTVEAVKRISAAKKLHDPDVPFMGTDEYAAPTPLDWERIGRHVDIQMQQSLPGTNGWLKYNPGYVTKFMRDLSGKPVYPFIQVIKYGLSPSPFQVHDWVNQTLRSGAEGIFVGAVEWFDRDLNHPMYTAPEKWHAYVDLVQQIQKLPKIRYPEKSEVALHYSSYTQMARRGTMEQSSFASTFSFLGPMAGAWFTVTDDFQIDRDVKKWDSYKIVFVPEAIYVSQNSMETMRHYAGQGGTIILSHPEALSWRIDGEVPEKFRQEITGIQLGEKVNQREIVWGNHTLKNGNQTARKIVQQDADVKILARFSDGTPAIVEHPVGKGRVISFTFNPCSNEAIDNADWNDAWRAFLQSNNIAVDQDIWRFALPAPEPLAKPKDISVTGNAVWMYQNKPITSSNSKAGGEYWYDNPPQAIADAATEMGRIDFSQGKLTNRLAMATGPKTDRGYPTITDYRKLEPWIVKYGENETKPAAITFKLNQPGNITRVGLIASGYLPTTTVSVSADGATWQTAGSIDAVNMGEDVASKEIAFNRRSQYVRFQFAERPAQTPFTLSEVDIWASSSKP